MKNDSVFKRTFNGMLDSLCKEGQAGAALPTENELARQYRVSRTTIRKALAILVEKGLVRRNGPELVAHQRPTAVDYFARADTVPTSDRVEKKFMEWMLRGDR